MAKLENADITARLEFLKEAAGLKDVVRSAHTNAGTIESVAAHSWRLTLLALTFRDALPADVDFAKLISLLIVHDLGETYGGDIPAIHQTPATKAQKSDQERADVQRLTQELPSHLGRALTALWEEYEAGETLEAKLAKGFDKIETLLQHTHGKNPADFDYMFNLQYGREWTDSSALLADLRQIVDEWTRAKRAE
ncbi:MAG: HD domain-containing protein [Pseudomonadota bacterium]